MTSLTESQLRELRTVSFSKCLIAVQHAAQASRGAGRRHPVYALDSKILAYRFAQALKLRVPKVHGVKVPLEAIDFQPGTVTEPVDQDSARRVHRPAGRPHMPSR